MSTTTTNKTPRTIIAADSAPTSAELDLRTASGGMLTMKITNAATGPTAQLTGTVYMAHSSSGTAPTLAGEGADWKTLYQFGGGTVANAVTPTSIEVSDGVGWLQVRFENATGTAPKCEAYFTERTSYTTV